MTREQCPLIALVGRPNVGKSTFFNRLSKSRKAIVDPTPGVTRDRHYERVVWNDRPFILIDTGGIEVGQHEMITGLIQDQTWQAVQEADIILFLLDGKSGVLKEDYDIISLLRKAAKPIYYIVNKVDGPEVEDIMMPKFYELGVSELWPVSSEHGYGITTFLDSFTESLKEEETDADQELPANTIRVACIGRPNVGKSSLINRLLGQERMVVSEMPGTTRDSVDALLTRGEDNYLLIDTAGIRRKGKVSEKLEKFSVMHALSALEKCDVALLLIDAGEGITEQDTKVMGYCLERGRACIIVINKWDLVKGDTKRQKWVLDEVERATVFAGYAPSMKISALSGSGVKNIFPEIQKVHQQFSLEFTTNKLNRVLQKAVEIHTPPIHKGKRLKLYYVTQVSTKPPTFIIFVNYPKGVHFSYHRFLVNQFRKELGLDKSPLRVVLKERQRKKYD
ncbi:MAG: ribosome biogenesis GTPase Der [Proteobacteria bacterium]|nr:ribosome biogenesis GTPase Der [Pseudomonadota bacterium]MBU1711106.1 ribosome biogenesis GTPase Der [Pseudomonadota bacterium]